MTSLARVRDLRVAALTSAFSVVDADGDVREIARHLGVDAIVTGNVQKAGGHLRITAQLVDGREGSQLWGSRYDREASDMFALEDEVTAAIIEHLHLALVPEEREGVFRRRTGSLEAHRLYLEGLECLWTRSAAADAIDRFHGAIEKDPGSAQTCWGLSDAYLQPSFWSTMRPTEASRHVKRCARKALALDSSLGDPHGALSYVHVVHDWDHEAAGREIREALRLSPNSSMVRAYYSWFLLHAGRVDEGVAEALKAQALGPASSFVAFAVGLAFLVRGDFGRATDEVRAGLRMNPDYHIILGIFGLTALANRQYADALAAGQAAVDLSGRLPFYVAVLAMALEHAGRREEARALWTELQDRASREYVPPVCFVVMYGVRGRLASVWRWLVRAGSAHDSYLAWFRILPPECFRAPGEWLIVTRAKTIVIRRLIGRVIARYRAAEHVQAIPDYHRGRPFQPPHSALGHLIPETFQRRRQVPPTPEKRSPAPHWDASLRDRPTAALRRAPTRKPKEGAGGISTRVPKSWAAAKPTGHMLWGGNWNQRIIRNERFERIERWRKRLGVEPAADTDSKGLTALSNSADPRFPILCRGEPPNCPQRETRLTGFLAGGGFRLHSPWPGIGPSRSCQRPSSSNSHEPPEIPRARGTIQRGGVD